MQRSASSVLLEDWLCGKTPSNAGSSVEV